MQCWLVILCKFSYGKCFRRKANIRRRSCSCMALYVICMTSPHYINISFGFPFCQKLCSHTSISLFNMKSVLLISLLRCSVKVNGNCDGFLNIQMPFWTNALQVLPPQLTGHRPIINLIHLHPILINFSTYSIFYATIKGKEAPWT